MGWVLEVWVLEATGESGADEAAGCRRFTILLPIERLRSLLRLLGLLQLLGLLLKLCMLLSHLLVLLLEVNELTEE